MSVLFRSEWLSIHCVTAVIVSIHYVCIEYAYWFACISITGSVDGRFSCRAQLAHHTGAVMGLACMSVTTTAGETITICSTSADNNVGIWRATVDESTTSTSDAFTLLQTISMGNGFALALALSVLPASDGSLVPVLAIGGDDAKIRVYTEAPQTSTETTSTEVFRFGVAVPGHEDWVRTLAFAATLPMGVDAESPPRAPASAPGTKPTHRIPCVRVNGCQLWSF